MLFESVALLSAVIGGVGESADKLAVVRTYAGDPKSFGEISLGVSNVLQPSILESPLTAEFGFDPSFFRYSGARPARRMFGADLDGDQVDEVFVLSERLDRGGRYVISAHDPPVGFQNVSHPLDASLPKALGSRPAFGEIIAIDGIDRDGDGLDEIMLLRQVASGSQRIEIVRMLGSTGQFGPPIASFLGISLAGNAPILDIAAVDMDGDAHEEIALLRSAADGTVFLDVVRSPSVLADPGLIVFGSVMLPPIENPILEIDAIDLDADGIDEIVARRHQFFFDPSEPVFVPNPGAGEIFPISMDALNFLRLPTGGTIVPGLPPAETQLIFGDAIHEVVVLRGPTPKPGAPIAPLDTVLNTTFEGSIEVTASTGSYTGGTIHTDVGPFVSVKGKLIDLDFELTIPGASAPLRGVLDPLHKRIDFDDTVVEVADPQQPGKRVIFHANDMTIAVFGPQTFLSGTLSGVLETGADTLPFTNATFALTHH